jgi:cobalt-zinc-cadmium efflux system protein
MHDVARQASVRTPVGSATRLGLVLALTVVYAAVEIVGGLVARSLALLADAGHMTTDILALTLALLAAWSARRPPDRTRTYGYARVEILAALGNSVALVVIAFAILREAWQRAFDPPEVQAGLMAVVAMGGLVVNLIAMRLLGPHQHGLNVRAAYLHVLGDLLGSLGVLVAAGLAFGLGWSWADTAVSAVVALILVAGAVRVVVAAVNVLLEGAPPHLDTAEVEACLAAVPGVGDVHDLHLWSLGGRTPILSAHLVLDHSVPAERVLRAATAAVAGRFAIEHTTLQVEPPDYNIVDRLTPAGTAKPEA